jgi:hypothetical protein
MSVLIPCFLYGYFNAFNRIFEGTMDKLIERLPALVAYNCRQVIDEGHELSVESVGGSENPLFEVRCAKLANTSFTSVGSEADRVMAAAGYPSRRA